MFPSQEGEEAPARKWKQCPVMWEENQKKVVFWKPKEAQIMKGSSSNENYTFTHEFSHVSITVALGKSCLSEEVRCDMPLKREEEETYYRR